MTFLKMNSYRILALFFLLAIFLGSNARAQNFEGTVKWSVSTRYNDPAKQAQIEAAQKKMEAAQQNKSKEMEFLKEREQAISSDTLAKRKGKANNTDDVSGSGFPTSFVVRIKDGNTLTVMDGGAQLEMLYLKNDDEVYALNRKRKTYRVMPKRDKRQLQSGSMEMDYTKTAETATILTYTCTKYEKTFVESGKLITQEVWATTDIHQPDLSSLGKQRFLRHQWSLDKIEGVPLRLVTNNSEITVTLQAVSISKEPVDDKHFRIPLGFSKAGETDHPDRKKKGD